MTRVYSGIDPDSEERARKTAGLMHDLNNDLLVMQGCIDLLKIESSNSANSKLLRLLQDAQEAQQRLEEKSRILSDIFHNNLNKSILLRNVKRVLHLNPIAQYVVEMAKYKLYNGTSITLNLDPDLWQVQGKEIDIERLLVNLVENAFAAIPPKGLISLSSKNVCPKSGLVSAFPEKFYLSEEKRYVLLTVQDNGAGIDESILPYIFKPTFTTKDKGRGLGLCVVKEVIEDHGGWIHLESTPGQGTKIQVYFPAHAGKN